jgi:hypothetical protein
MDRRPRLKLVCTDCGESLLYRRWGHDLVCDARRRSLVEDEHLPAKPPRDDGAMRPARKV